MGEFIGLMAVTLPMVIAIVAIWTKHQRQMAEMQLLGSQDEARSANARNAELEDRLRVLERIVTDKGYDVAAQIEALRDDRKLDAIEDRSRVS
ncbi:MAG: hypothetical protein RLY97_176 [Pseudomonadota bacterium]|jgi:hypothetical protein